MMRTDSMWLLVGMTAACLVVCFTGRSARAVDIQVSRQGTLSIAGNDRFEYRYLTSFPLDETGLVHRRPPEGDFAHRLRLGPVFRHGDWEAGAEADVTMYHHLYGGRSDIGEGYDSSIHSQAKGFRPFGPRKLYVSYRSPIGIVKAGMMTSHWGLGLVANGGDEPTGEFASPWFGDVVLRAGLITPFLRAFTSHPVADQIFFAGFFDVVFLDENADLVEGDLALQGALSLFYQWKERLFAGLYVAIRRQDDRGGTFLNVVATDLFLKLEEPLKPRLVHLYAAAEGVVIAGKTDRVLTEGGPQGTEVLAGAVVGRLGLRFPSWGLRIGLEAGWASGDNDMGDSQTRQFRLDPDYQPSLILFRHVLSAITGHGADRAGDPSRVGTPAQGTDQFPTYGSLRNIVYLQPVVEYQPFPGRRHLDGARLKVGLLYARTAADFTDPYNTFRNGGLNQTFLGLPAASRRELGYELNVSLAYEAKLWREVSLGAAVIYGHFFPGRAFDDASQDRASVDMLEVRVTARF